ncbi:hypothetical protein U9M48_018184 [Paspalum notatum var. saurae]|uniref:Uncharacterized protein n=1 Tax=Paspalum notatum var. saurae TaxID=547442 RepID=A0AAQ3T9J1_PASNO
MRSHLCELWREATKPCPGRTACSAHYKCAETAIKRSAAAASDAAKLPSSLDLDYTHEVGRRRICAKAWTGPGPTNSHMMSSWKLHAESFQGPIDVEVLESIRRCWGLEEEDILCKNDDRDPDRKLISTGQGAADW